MVQNMGPLIPTRWKNPWSERIRYIGQRMEARRAVHAAAHVIAPTAFVKEFLMRAWGIPDHRVSVLHYGAALPVSGGMQRPLSIPEAWRNSFIFTAGSIEPYRGLEDILGAVALLQAHGMPARLAIAGSARENMRSYERRLRQWVERRGLTECVRWVGNLSTQEMAWCYTSCSTFIMTSRVETFAIIGTEALVYGCVCIVAENPPFPEVFDGAATYYTPGNSASLVAAIRAVMRWGPAERMQASVRAKQRAASFSWDTHVQRLVRCFATLQSSHPALPE
jgi:glycosyltransferase involved in cell wall biosynthesis